MIEVSNKDTCEMEVMEMDKALFRAFMVRYGDTQRTLAEALGISLSCLNAKINGKADFRQTEIAFLKERYKMNSDNISDIFFAKKVS